MCTVIVCVENSQALVNLSMWQPDKIRILQTILRIVYRAKNVSLWSIYKTFWHLPCVVIGVRKILYIAQDDLFHQQIFNGLKALLSYPVAFCDVLKFNTERVDMIIVHAKKTASATVKENSKTLWWYKNFAGNRFSISTGFLLPKISFNHNADLSNFIIVDRDESIML